MGMHDFPTQLDPKTRPYMEALEALPRAEPAISNTPPLKMRRDQILALPSLVEWPPQEVARVEDRRVAARGGAVGVRFYYSKQPGLRPLLIFFRGGGHVAGGLETHDPLCRSLCNATGAIVASVD